MKRKLDVDKDEITSCRFFFLKRLLSFKSTKDFLSFMESECTPVLTASNCTCCIYLFLTILIANRNYFIKRHEKLIFVRQKCRILFDVRTDFLILFVIASASKC